MQLIWISGATSKVQKFNITPKGLMKIGSVIGVFFLLCGMGVHFIGFKVALQVRPDFARSFNVIVTGKQIGRAHV